MTTTAATVIAQALADPTRLKILERLTDGPAAVSELTVLTGEPQPKVSNHLAVLRERGLVDATRIGRQRVYAVSDPSVAQLIESLGILAGRLGVAIFDALVVRRAIRYPDPRYRGPIDLGPAGPATFEDLGIDLNEIRLERRRFATACGDWSERRAHLGGALGAALWARTLERGWVVCRPGTRIVVVTKRGRRALHQRLGIRAAGDRRE